MKKVTMVQYEKGDLVYSKKLGVLRVEYHDLQDDEVDCYNVDEDSYFLPASELNLATKTQAKQFKSSSLSVEDSGLDYRMVFNGKEFSVGCQHFGVEEAKKIVKFLSDCLKEVKKPKAKRKKK